MQALLRTSINKSVDCLVSFAGQLHAIQAKLFEEIAVSHRVQELSTRSPVEQLLAQAKHTSAVTVELLEITEPALKWMRDVAKLDSAHPVTAENIGG